MWSIPQVMEKATIRAPADGSWEALRGQLTMAAGPGGDGDGVRLAARRAHVALPPDRITKAGLPTSGPWEIAESAPGVVRYS